jgi:hypothetical protein
MNCKNLSRDNCLPPNCKYINGPKRKYCRNNTRNARNNNVRNNLTKKVLSKKVLSKPVLTKKVSRCKGLAKNNCFQPCRYVNTPKRQYCRISGKKNTEKVEKATNTISRFISKTISNRRLQRLASSPRAPSSRASSRAPSPVHSSMPSLTSSPPTPRSRVPSSRAPSPTLSSLTSSSTISSTPFIWRSSSSTISSPRAPSSKASSRASITSSRKMELFRNSDYLYLLNSFFSKIDLIFKFDKIINNSLYFVIDPKICKTTYGLKLSINKKTKKLYIMLLSNCKNIRGTTILSLMKKFACKINSNEIFLQDQQYLVLEPGKVIDNIASLDIAVNGESWYNKMGFYKKDANPEEDKRINIEKSKKPLSSVLKSKLIKRFKEAFKDDSNIDVNNSIKNIFTIIKSDYLKNKTKKITINQCYIISQILSILKHYYKYNSELYYNNSDCSKSLN